MSIKSTLVAALAGTALLSVAPAHAEFGDTLKKVKERGALACTGHNGSYKGSTGQSPSSSLLASTR